MSLNEAQQYAKDLGFQLNFDWETPRTQEGFYQLEGNVEYCGKRGNQYLKYADCFWMETDKPCILKATLLSQLIKKHHPKKFLAYNLSPSFNWSDSGMSDDEITQFCKNLGNLGFVWQFITLAGFHMDALASEKFSKNFQTQHMIAYVEKIQRKESKYNVDQLTHQRWSGTELIDKQVQLVTNSTTFLSTNKESTEYQFTKAKI